jgi:hypothetical protein
VGLWKNPIVAEMLGAVSFMQRLGVFADAFFPSCFPQKTIFPAFLGVFLSLFCNGLER